MQEANSPDQMELFSSDIIDLSDFDLPAVADLPNSVLRAAIERIRAELASGRETTAFFESSLRPPAGERRAAPTGKPQQQPGPQRKKSSHLTA